MIELVILLLCHIVGIELVILYMCIYKKTLFKQIIKVCSYTSVLYTLSRHACMPTDLGC